MISGWNFFCCIAILKLIPCLEVSGSFIFYYNIDLVLEGHVQDLFPANLFETNGFYFPKKRTSCKNMIDITGVVRKYFLCKFVRDFLVLR